MKALVLALALLGLNSAWALPLGHFDALRKAEGAKLAPTPAPLFEGIVKLSNCSGSLITLEGMPADHKAIVMTNGHCVQKPGGFLSPGEVWVNRPVSRSLGVYTKNMELKRFNAKRIIYATMTGTDVTLYEVDMTYAQIKQQFGIEPLLLSNTRPLEHVKMNIPSGYWDRNWACNTEGFVFKLRESDWTWTDSIRYNQECDTIGGTSGSPIVEDGTRTVIGINNTSNEDGERCTLNNPCEVDEAGREIIIKQRSYGQQTYHIYGCMNEAFEIDLNLASCELAKP